MKNTRAAMRKLRRFLAPLTLGGLGSLAWAGAGDTANSGTISEVRVDNAVSSGMIIFSSNNGGSTPGCVNSAYKNAYAFDTSTAQGKAVLAWALSAKAAGTTVVAYGLGTCAVYGVVEDLDYAQG